MSRDNKASLSTHHEPTISTQMSKRQLLANFIKFMAWVAVIGLLLSPLACTIEPCEVTNEQR